MISTIILFIVILGVLVLVHELGHFVAARRFKMGVEEFGFGFPPRLFGIQRTTDPANPQRRRWRFVSLRKPQPDAVQPSGKTIYSINAIPLGGFVKIKGEQGEQAADEDSFAHKKIWQRGIVLSAGVTMNIVLACFLITIGFMIGAPSVVNEDLPSQAIVKDKRIQIVEVREGSPAAEAGLKAGDFLLTANGQPITDTPAFQSFTKPLVNQDITLGYQRGTALLSTTVTPADLENTGEGLIGIWLIDTGLVRYPFIFAIWMGLKTTGLITWQILASFFDLLKNLVTAGHLSADVAGPVGIAALTGQVAKLGWLYILQFTALLSINLAIINFIPFPALDGGRMLFLAIEKIRGRAVNRKIEAVIHNIGFLFLIGLVIIVTYRDISRFSDSIRSAIGKIFG